MLIDNFINKNEFATLCVKQLCDENKLLIYSIRDTFELLLKKSIENRNEILYIKEIKNSIVIDDNCTITDLINKGDFILSMYKVKLAYTKDLDIDDIYFDFPCYIKLDSNFPGRKKAWKKQKELKTQKNATLQFAKLSIKKEVLLEIEKMLPVDFFLKNLHSLGGYKHTIMKELCSFENLPYPYVLYPSLTGPILGFKKEKKSRIVFCSCQKKVILNFIKIQNIRRENGERINRNYINREIDDLFFNVHGRTPELIFIDNICHECNEQPPNFYYCSPGQRFMGLYGWYVDKRFYQYGIDLETGILYLKDDCPSNIKEKIRYNDYDLISRIYAMDFSSDEIDNYEKKYSKTIYEIDKDIRKQISEVRNEIENVVREKLHFKKIGEEWVSETVLYKEVKKEFPETKVIHHGQPDWLGRQHLDVWIPEWKIAVEYQGIQHYQPVERFGGEEGFRKTLERDNRKRKLCIENGVQLFEMNEEMETIQLINRIKILRNKKYKA